MEELCKKQAETIKLLTDAILTNSKQEYIKSIKHICIAIITSFTILICFLVICILQMIIPKKYAGISIDEIDNFVLDLNNSTIKLEVSAYNGSMIKLSRSNNTKIITKERNRGGIIREKRKKFKMRKKN